MKHTFDIFRADSGDVQHQWVRYTEKMDRLCEEAFRLNVKWSLQELNKAINGDGRNDPSPLFKVALDLDSSSDCGETMVFIPDIPELTNVVTTLGSQLTDVVSCIQRLPDLLTKKRSHRSVSCNLTKFSFHFCSLATCYLSADPRNHLP